MISLEFISESLDMIDVFIFFSSFFLPPKEADPIKLAHSSFPFNVPGFY